MDDELAKMKREKQAATDELRSSMESELQKIQSEKAAAADELRKSMEDELKKLKEDKAAEIAALRKETTELRQKATLPAGPRNVRRDSDASETSAPRSARSDEPPRDQTDEFAVITTAEKTLLRSKSSAEVLGSAAAKELRALRKSNAELRRELRDKPEGGNGRPKSLSMPERPPPAPFFAAAPRRVEEDAVAALASCLDQFPHSKKQGGFLWKVPFHATGALPQRRWFRVALRRAAGPHGRDDVVLAWGAARTGRDGAEMVSARQDRVVALEDVLEIRPGHATPAWWVQAAAQRTLPEPDLCWSLVCKDRTLDVAAETDDDAKSWRRALRGCVALLHRRRKRRFDGDDTDDDEQRDDSSVRTFGESSSIASSRRMSGGDSVTTARSSSPEPHASSAAAVFRDALERRDASTPARGTKRLRARRAERARS